LDFQPKKACAILNLKNKAEVSVINEGNDSIQAGFEYCGLRRRGYLSAVKTERF
jgi:hypothetical protein